MFVAFVLKQLPHRRNGFDRRPNVLALGNDLVYRPAASLRRDILPDETSETLDYVPPSNEGWGRKRG